jgi:hypothetical protein
VAKRSGVRRFFNRLLLPIAATAMSAAFQLSIAAGWFRGTLRWALYLIWIVTAGLWITWILTHDKVTLWLGAPFGSKITTAEKTETGARRTEEVSYSWLDLFKDKVRKVTLWLGAPLGSEITTAEKTETGARRTEEVSYSWLDLFKEKLRLEEELASLEAQIPSIRVVPVIKIGKDDVDFLREKIGRKKNEIKQIDERMKRVAHD